MYHRKEKNILSQPFLQSFMRIAIVGAGFAGLSAAWYLAKKNCSITLFDKREFNDSTSRIAAGLVHPYGSKRLTQAFEGMEAFETALSLFQEASAYQEDDFILHRGMVRLIGSDDDSKDLNGFSGDEAKNYHKDLAPIPGTFVKDSLTIDTNLYLNALMKGLKDFGTIFIEESVESLEQLKDFDAVVLASGYETLAFKEAENLPLRYLKGQGIELLLPSDMEPLEYAISSEIYVVMLKDKKRLFAGATFERGISDPEPDHLIAKERILPRLERLFPRLKGIEPIAIRSGVRLTSQGYFPLAKKIGPRLFVFSGLGSKGLLYHAHLGKKLADEICDSIE